MSDMEDTFGPALPPGFCQTATHSSTDSKHTPPEQSIGPAIPGVSSKRDATSETEDSDSSSSDSESEFRHKVIGPLRPNECQHSDTSSPKQDSDVIGPALPPRYMRQQSNDDDVNEQFGPIPPAMDQQVQGQSAAEEFEERARKMKDKLLHGSDESNKPVERESWMTVLPSVGLSKHLGLVARKLGDGCKVKDEDQSVWTDTPADRERKAKEEQLGVVKKRKHKDIAMSTRDKEMSEQVECYNKEKRAQSLLEMHTKKLKKQIKEKKKKEKKKKKKEKKSGKKSETVKERRPFDRDSDLNVNRFDNAQKKLLIKRSQELNTKFSHGGHQFL